ncbi:MAG: hypothetical protein HY906_24450 [Deltaproteobacteria bacterium]|nr:hypothetical protein [Deltaproteobacteria bacterium]
MIGSRPGRRRTGAWLALVVLSALVRPAAAQEVPVEPAAPPPAAAATATPPLVTPASQPLAEPLLKGKSLQPGERGHKSLAWAAAWSFGSTLLPVLMGGFLTRSQQDDVMWTGLGLIAAAQSFGPSAGYWYARERARFTWYRLALSGIALAAAGYPLYAYTGRLESYNSGGAAALVTLAVVAEAVTLALAAWDLSLLGDAVERHNERPVRPPASQPLKVRAAAPMVAPVVVPGGGGVGLTGWF